MVRGKKMKRMMWARWMKSKLAQELGELASEGMVVENQTADLTALEICVLSLMEKKGSCRGEKGINAVRCASNTCINMHLSGDNWVSDVSEEQLWKFRREWLVKTSSCFPINHSKLIFLYFSLSFSQFLFLSLQRPENCLLTPHAKCQMLIFCQQIRKWLFTFAFCSFSLSGQLLFLIIYFFNNWGGDWIWCNWCVVKVHLCVIIYYCKAITIHEQNCKIHYNIQSQLCVRN